MAVVEFLNRLVLRRGRYWASHPWDTDCALFLESWGCLPNGREVRFYAAWNIA